jgi:Ca-activated chloride channel family protein
VLSLGLIAIIIGWANLQSGDKPEKVQRKGVDVVIALDVSKSMLATDVAPDRLTKAKQLIMLMTEKMQNDRVAFIVFAGRAYVQLPLTVDYNVMKMMLQNASPDMVPFQGTVIGEAIDMGIKAYSDNNPKYKSLILITDGEDHDESAIEMTKKAAEAGIVVNTVGIGSPQGATLYDPQTRAPKLDETGSPVVSKLNEEELKAIASAGHGTYTLLQNPEVAAQKLISGLEGMEQRSLGSMEFTEFTSFFQYFLLAGFVALVVEWLLPGARSKKRLIA